MNYHIQLIHGTGMTIAGVAEVFEDTRIMYFRDKDKQKLAAVPIENLASYKQITDAEYDKRLSIPPPPPSTLKPTVVGAENEPEYEVEEMQLTMDTLQTHADHCLKYNLPLALLIDMPGFDSPELITNPPANIGKKMAYYREVYNENCEHKHATGIRIVAFVL